MGRREGWAAVGVFSACLSHELLTKGAWACFVSLILACSSVLVLRTLCLKPGIAAEKALLQKIALDGAGAGFLLLLFAEFASSVALLALLCSVASCEDLLRSHDVESLRNFIFSIGKGNAAMIGVVLCFGVAAFLEEGAKYLFAVRSMRLRQRRCCAEHTQEDLILSCLVFALALATSETLFFLSCFAEEGFHSLTILLARFMFSFGVHVICSLHLSRIRSRMSDLRPFCTAVLIHGTFDFALFLGKLFMLLEWLSARNLILFEVSVGILVTSLGGASLDHETIEKVNKILNYSKVERAKDSKP